MISGLTKKYYIISSMQKISQIHRFILEIIKQILDSQDLKGHSHILPSAYIPIVIFHFPDTMCIQKSSRFIHSEIRVSCQFLTTTQPKIIKAILSFPFLKVH